MTESAPRSCSPRVSVVVPTFNRRKLLEETLETIFAQTLTDFELIVVDNMSEDGTEEYVRSIADPRVRYFRNPNHGVIAVNRNFGIRKAVGSYVAFCDDDDLWLPEKLEKQLAAFGEGISSVATDCTSFGEVVYLGKSLSFAPGERWHDFDYREILVQLNPVISSSVVARRDLLLELEGFDESSDFRFIEDWELWLRLSRKGAIRILNEPLLKYRMYQKAGRDDRNVALRTLKIVEKHEALGFFDAETARRARANCCVLIGRAFLEAGDREGMRYYLKGLGGGANPQLRLRALLGLGVFLLPAWGRSRLFRLARRES